MLFETLEVVLSDGNIFISVKITYKKMDIRGSHVLSFVLGGVSQIQNCASALRFDRSTNHQTFSLKFKLLNLDDT